MFMTRAIRRVCPHIRSRLASPKCAANLSSESEAKSSPPTESELTAERKFVPRRALLYVPGNDERKMEKVSALDVDCVVFDCEDGVALNKKDEARHTIQKCLQSLDLGRTECAVRINSADTPLGEEDMKVIFSGEKIPQTVLLPKVEKREHLDWFAERLVKAVGKRKLKLDINLITYVESAKGLLDLRDICNHAIEMSEFHVFGLEGIVFGSDDFCASIGATRTNSASEVLLARQQVVITAKAFDLQAIDVVYIDYKDLDGLRVQSQEGAKMGFTGKQAIHPSQVPIIQDSFRPSDAKIEWATELIKQFKAQQTDGKGAFVFRDQMIDRPLLLQAQNILEIANSLKINDSFNKSINSKST